MLVASWNVQGILGISDGRLDGIVERLARLKPDVVLLQEVGHVNEQPTRLAARLDGVGLSHFHHVLPLDHQHRELGRGDYGSAVASRWPLVAHESTWLNVEPDRTLWPELLARATVQTEDGDVEVISVHIPNGSANGWTKIDHFEALARALGQLRGRSVVVGGDFNEPRIERPDGRWICWGESEGPDGAWGVWETWAFGGVRNTGKRWDDAVRSILADENTGGLIDACRTVRGAEAVATTHVSRGQARFFDHILVSPDFRVDDMGFEHAWREEKWSDHSAVWARISKA